MGGAYLFKSTMAEAEEGEKKAADEQKPALTQAEAEEDLMGETSILKELKADKIKEVFQNSESKFIYFYSKSQLSPEEFQRVEEFA